MSLEITKQLTNAHNLTYKYFYKYNNPEIYLINWSHPAGNKIYHFNTVFEVGFLSVHYILHMAYKLKRWTRMANNC